MTDEATDTLRDRLAEAAFDALQPGYIEYRGDRTEGWLRVVDAILAVLSTDEALEQAREAMLALEGDTIGDIDEDHAEYEATVSLLIAAARASGMKEMRVLERSLDKEMRVLERSLDAAEARIEEERLALDRLIETAHVVVQQATARDGRVEPEHVALLSMAVAYARRALSGEEATNDRSDP